MVVLCGELARVLAEACCALVCARGCVGWIGEVYVAGSAMLVGCGKGRSSPEREKGVMLGRERKGGDGGSVMEKDGGVYQREGGGWLL